jgi:group I intron endonuclease
MLFGVGAQSPKRSAGRTHSEETLAKMSDSQKLAQPLVDRTGANNPMYGKSHTKEARALISIQVNVYSPDNVLIHKFSSMTAAAKFLNTSKVQVHRYVRSGKVFQSKYLISTTILSN